MELNRASIAERGFPTTRDGYDPEAVEAHLTEVANAVEALRSPRLPELDVANEASEKLKAIVEGAEQSASQLRLATEREAEQSRAEAERYARETTQRADAEAEAHLASLQAAVDGVHSGSPRSSSGSAKPARWCRSARRRWQIASARRLTPCWRGFGQR